MAPKDEAELQQMVAIEYTDGSIAMRFPRGNGYGVPLWKKKAGKLPTHRQRRNYPVAMMSLLVGFWLNGLPRGSRNSWRSMFGLVVINA